MMVAPCKNCSKEEKYEGCHDHCEKFLKWKAKKDSLTEKKRKENNLYSIWPVRQRNNYERIRKK